jgi:hypothetical protein
MKYEPLPGRAAASVEHAAAREDGKVNHTRRLSVYLSLHPALESRGYLPAAEQLDACAADIAISRFHSHASWYWTWVLN